MMKKLNRMQLLEILKAGNLNEIVGCLESENLEFKGSPYQVSEDYGKYELAKDISGFANASGGLIVVGVKTKKSPEVPYDEVEEIRPFAQDLINVEQYLNVTRSWIYPTVRQLSIDWYRSAETLDRGIIVIAVPDQESGKPFLIRKSVDSTGKVFETVFGYAERHQAATIPLSVQEIHSLIRDGRVLLQERQRQETGEAKSVPQIVTPRAESIISERIEAAIKDVGLEGKPFYVLAAVPLDAVTVPDLFESRNAAVARLIGTPPPLRHAGFDVDAGGNTQIIRGELLRASLSGYKLLELWRDGTLILVASGGPDFLCWRAYEKAETSFQINNLAVVESAYLFVQLSGQVFDYMEPRPRSLLYRIRLGNMTSSEHSCYLVPVPVRSIGWQSKLDQHGAPEPSVEFSYQWSGGNFLPGAIALELVSRLYAWFGVTKDRIPYTKQVDSKLVIDSELIKRG